MMSRHLTLGIICFGLAMAPSWAAWAQRSGDIDGDGTITGTDLQMLIGHIAASAELFGDPLGRANPNLEGDIDAADVVWLVNYLNGPEALEIARVRAIYSSPYLLDFLFSLRDENDNAVILHPSSFDVTAMEDGDPISPSETAFLLVGEGVRETVNRELKSFLVLDYTESMIDPVANGDSDGDGISDAVETMEEATKAFIDSLTEDAQAGIYEFHREDVDPAVAGRVSGFTTDKPLLKSLVDSILPEFVQGFSAGSRAWDALFAAVQEFEFGEAPDELRFIVFLGDGTDESSLHTPDQIISAAGSREVRIYSIGFGAELDPTILQTIADATSAEYHAASSEAALITQFDQIVRDAGGQYALRWATLRRSAEDFIPSFEISVGPASSEISGGPGSPEIKVVSGLDEHFSFPYNPADHAGDVLRGSLRIPEFSINREAGTATVFIRASYVPRDVNAFNIRVLSPFDYTVSRAGLTAAWPPPSVTTHPGDPRTWIFLFSFSGDVVIPYGAFGPILRFDFTGLPPDVDENLFQEILIDNTIYEATGGQFFVLEDFVPASLPRLGVAPNFITLSELSPSAQVTVQNLGNLLLGWTAEWTDPGIVVSPAGAQANSTEVTITATDFGTQRVVRVRFRNVDNPQNFVDVMVEVLGPGMVTVPAGSFLMGDPFDEGATDERPVHPVVLSAFEIGRHEVTNGEFAAYLNKALAAGEITETNGTVFRNNGSNVFLCQTSEATEDSQIDFDGRRFTVDARASAPIGPRTEPVDLGAYAQVLYVDGIAGSDAGGDGTAAKPWGTINFALAQIGDASPSNRYALLVAEGRYTSSSAFVVEMRSNVDIYGGFEAAGWTRDLSAHVSLLDGENVRGGANTADNTKLDGFMLRRSPGDAIQVSTGRSRVISNNTFTGNSGVGVNYVALTFQGTLDIRNNAFVGNQGTAIMCFGDGIEAIIEGNVFVGNTGANVIRVFQESWLPFIVAHIVNNLFASNSHPTGGAVIGVDTFSNARLDNNTFAGNSTEDRATVTFSSGTLGFVFGNVIVGNVSATGGGGILCDGSFFGPFFGEIQNNLIAQNTAGGSGGGIQIRDASPLILNNTISQNVAPSGGGISIDGASSAPRISNTILWDNSSGLEVLNGAVPGVDHSDVQGGFAGPGNISEDPQFRGFVVGGVATSIGFDVTRFQSTLVDPNTHLTAVDLAGKVMRVGTGHFAVASNSAREITVWGDVTQGGAVVAPLSWDLFDFHLTAGSPCIDVGDPATPVVSQELGVPVDEDIDGDVRPIDLAFSGRDRTLDEFDIGADEFKHPRGDHPMAMVSWHGAAAFCNWLSRQEGLEEVYTESGDWPSDLNRNGYHLPTEAQWERAAGWDPGRGHWRFGFASDFISQARANFRNGGPANPLNLPDPPFTSPVGFYNGSTDFTFTVNSPSDAGCYDMSGNVWEWCNDWYDVSFYGSSPLTDPEGPSTGTQRVLRGGSWDIFAIFSRSAQRFRNPPEFRFPDYGFRVVRSPQAPAP
jgi:formylglycine-generating enzyme required for sulfatase activity